MLRLFALVLMAGASSASADDLAERPAVCFSCHGEGGESYNAETPSLGGEPAPFVLIQLYLFREKQRRVEPMTQAAQGLSDDDLRGLSEAIAKLPPPKPPDGPVDATRIERAWSLVRKHHCLFCHHSDFSGHENVPRLAGQREDYLLKALLDFKSNTRPGYDASMAEAVRPISEAELADLAYLMARARGEFRGLLHAHLKRPSRHRHARAYRNAHVDQNKVPNNLLVKEPSLSTQGIGGSCGR